MVIKMAIHTGAKAEPDNITETPQDEVGAAVKHSEVVEVLGFGSISSDCWTRAHFCETPRQFDSNGNLTIFWDDSIDGCLSQEVAPLTRLQNRA